MSIPQQRLFFWICNFKNTVPCLTRRGTVPSSHAEETAMTKILPVPGYTASLLSAHHATHAPLPPQFLLVVVEDDIAFVLFEGYDKRLSDRTSATLLLSGKEVDVLILAAVDVDRAWNEIALACEQKVAWYCGIIGQPRRQSPEPVAA